MRLLFHEIWITNLAKGFSEDFYLYISQEEAYELLKKYSGEDFGYDVSAWKQWFKENVNSLPSIKEVFYNQDDEI